jgi:hypothetical protein
MSRLPELVRTPAGAAEAVYDSASLRKSICDSALRECEEAFRDRLRAVISTGSVARDEASFLRRENSFVVCGDAEFLVVFKKNAALPATAALGDVRRRIEKNLLQRNIQCKIDLSAVHMGYFQHLPAHIFTYELKHCGRIIAGDERILQTIPDYSPGDLSREDAWRLLCNRLVEILECADELSREDKQPSSVLRYKIVKLYLDMAASFLVYVGAFVPTYRERCEALMHLAAGKPMVTEYPFDLSSFAEIVADCTEQKLAPSAAGELSMDVCLHAAIQLARALWRWELTQLVATKEELTDAELFDRWIRQLPFRKNICGWLYILRACGWRHSDVVLLRWLNLRKASPRHWIYLIASTLLFQWNTAANTSERQAQDADLAKLARYLPIKNAARTDQQRLSWENLACDAHRNYQEFVAGTRA